MTSAHNEKIDVEFLEFSFPLYASVSWKHLEQTLRQKERHNRIVAPIPNKSMEWTEQLVAEAEEYLRFSKDLFWLPPERLLQYPIDGLSDIELAALAEIALLRVDDDSVTGADLSSLFKRSEEAWAQTLESPQGALLLDYAWIFKDIADCHLVKQDTKGIDIIETALAHDLRYGDGRYTLSFIQELARSHVECGDLEKGLDIYAELFKYDPFELSTYDSAAHSLCLIGMHSLGLATAKRWIDLGTLGHPYAHSHDFDLLFLTSQNKEDVNFDDCSAESIQRYLGHLLCSQPMRPASCLPELAKRAVPDIEVRPVKTMPV